MCVSAKPTTELRPKTPTQCTAVLYTTKLITMYAINNKIRSAESSPKSKIISSHNSIKHESLLLYIVKFFFPNIKNYNNIRIFMEIILNEKRCVNTNDSDIFVEFILILLKLFLDLRHLHSPFRWWRVAPFFVANTP